MDINLKSLLFELVFDPDKDGVTAISLVDSPAILTNFIKLNETLPDIKIVMANEEKRIVLGPAIIPNVKIFRSGRSLGLEQDAYVFFREDTIRALAEDYIMKAKNNNVTLQHKDKTYDVKMVESWIIEDPAKDKAAFYGFELPKGTWMTSFKILDDELWEDIKDGEMRGFSIEATLGLVPKGEISLSEEEPEAEPEDDRIVLEKELQPLFLQRLDEVGHKEDIMRQLGFVKVSEDGILTKEGEAIALTFAVSSEPAEKSALDDGLYAIRYKYAGPLDEKTRDFCRDVMTKDLIYRKEDIDYMSFRGENPMSKQNYSIFRYKGSYNCRHKWVKQVYFAADWEKALEDLELYLGWLNDVRSLIETRGLEDDGIIGKTYKILEEKEQEIAKTLQDFQKQGPFGDKGPQSGQMVSPNKLPDTYKEPEFDKEAQEVNQKVGLRKEFKFAEDIADSLTKLLSKLEDYDAVNKKLDEAYKETKEDVFTEAQKPILDFYKAFDDLFSKIE